MKMIAVLVISGVVIFMGIALIDVLNQTKDRNNEKK